MTAESIGNEYFRLFLSIQSLTLSSPAPLIVKDVEPVIKRMCKSFLIEGQIGMAGDEVVQGYREGMWSMYIKISQPVNNNLYNLIIFKIHMKDFLSHNYMYKLFIIFMGY